MGLHPFLNDDNDGSDDANASMAMVDPSSSKMMWSKSENNAIFFSGIACFVCVCCVLENFVCRSCDHITYQLRGLFRWSCCLTRLFRGRGGIARALTRLTRDLAPIVPCFEIMVLLDSSSSLSY
jgi:hypothetical protein